MYNNQQTRKMMIQALALVEPIDINHYTKRIGGGDDGCCGIHETVDFDSVVGGCGDIAMGTHKSVRAAYDGKYVYCHAEYGQKVVDSELVEKILESKVAFNKAAEVRTGVFLRRYAFGYPVDMSVYGAGYCYGFVFLESARSRAARILGPLPYLANVMYLMPYIGAMTIQNYTIVNVSDQVYHFKLLGSVDDRVDVTSLYGWMKKTVAKQPYARIGFDYNDRINEQFDYYDAYINFGGVREAFDIWLNGRGSLGGTEDDFGYCYLVMLPEDIRGNIAGRFGEYPPLQYVVMIMMICGPYPMNKINLVYINYTNCHAANISCDYEGKSLDNWYDALLKAIVILYSSKEIRVGGDCEHMLSATTDTCKCGMYNKSVIRSILFGGDEKFEHELENYKHQELHVMEDNYSGFLTDRRRYELLCDGLDNVDKSGRLEDILYWLAAMEILDDVPEIAYDDLLLATIPIMGYGEHHINIKNRIKVWAIIGDGVLKSRLALDTLDSGGSPKEYTTRLEKTTNNYLAYVMHSSGLHNCCSISGLKRESKVNADIVEAVIGVISLYAKHNVVDKLLANLGVRVPLLTLGTSLVAVKNDEDIADTHGLNSRQYGRAIALVKKGLI